MQEFQIREEIEWSKRAKYNDVRSVTVGSFEHVSESRLNSPQESEIETSWYG